MQLNILKKDLKKNSKDAGMLFAASILDLFLIIKVKLVYFFIEIMLAFLFGNMDDFLERFIV
jgi:hypothetical protein